MAGTLRIFGYFEHGDEDEGFSFHREINRVKQITWENREISGSPPGVPEPDIFPPSNAMTMPERKLSAKYIATGNFTYPETAILKWRFFQGDF